MIKSISWDYKPERKVSGFSLDKVSQLLEYLGDPQKKIPFPIHIVGTNGKGSTTSFLYSILADAGFRINVYTSPNLIFLNERIKISGKEVSDETLLEFLQKIPQNISFFEALTVVAFQLFAKSDAEFSLIEAGLGGRFDATNVFDPKLCICTSISFDHMEFLGNTIREITEEKLAIKKDNIPFVIAKQPYSEVYSYAANIKEAKIHGVDFEVKPKSETFKYSSKRWSFDGLQSSLLGEHQFFNAGNAICAVESLVFDYGFKISEENIRNGLKKTVWRGRMEELKVGKIPLQFPHLKVFVDGAHNENGIQTILEGLPKSTHLICGFLKRKNLDKILPKFAGFYNIHLVEIHSSEVSQSKDDLVKVFEDVEVKVLSANSHFLDTLNSIPKGEMVVIFGSLYLVGEVLEYNYEG